MTVEAATIYEVWTKTGGNWSREERLVLAELSRPVWPEVPTAHFRAVLADVGDVVPARMETGLGFASYDQEILVKKAGMSGECVFWGRISGRAPAWNAQGESVEFVARHAGAVLADFYILGSHGRAFADYDENGDPIAANQTYFSGMAAILNPDGRGNMSVTPYQPGETELCRLFAPPFYRTGSALRWQTKRFLAYLFYWAKQESALIEALDFPNPMGVGEGDLIGEPRDWAAEGRSWWEAIGGVLEAEGWRCRLGTTGTGTSPQAVLRMWRIGSGTKRTLVLDAAGGNVTAADNAQQGHLNFDASGVVTTPQVAGGPLVVEGTFRLYPGWLKADFDLGAKPKCDDMPDDDLLWDDIYYKRYVDDGRAVDFVRYADVGRKWILNEGGDYSLAIYNSPPTFNADAQIGQGIWCMRPRPFSKPLSWDSLLRPQPALMEVSFDSGAHWHKLDAASLLDEEAGIRISTKDLSKIAVPDGSDCSDADDYWGALWNDAYGHTDTVRVRVTACLADDSALVPDPALSVPAWAMVQRPVQHPYDRRTQYDKRVRLTSGPCASRWVGVCGADTRDLTANLTAEAQAIQAVTACLAVRGPVELFGTEWPYDPGDVITKIAGREIDLEQGGPPAGEIYAEVVSVLSRHLESQSMEVVLEDARMRLGPGGTAGGAPGGRG